MSKKQVIDLDGIFSTYLLNKSNLNLLKLRKAIESFSVIYINHLKIKLNPSDVDETISNIFIDVWRFADKFDSKKSKFKTWLMHIIRNEALQTIRRNKLYYGHVRSLGDIPVDALTHSRKLTGNQEDLYQAALEKSTYLCERDKQIFDQAFIDGLTYDELSKIHNIPKYKIPYHIFSIKTQVRIMVEKNLKHSGFNKLYFNELKTNSKKLSVRKMRKLRKTIIQERKNNECSREL